MQKRAQMTKLFLWPLAKVKKMQAVHCMIDAELHLQRNLVCKSQIKLHDLADDRPRLDGLNKPASVVYPKG